MPRRRGGRSSRSRGIGGRSRGIGGRSRGIGGRLGGFGSSRSSSSRYHGPSLVDVAFMSMPQSDPYKIIFPFDRLSNVYSSNDFHPQKTGNRVSQQEITTILDKFSTIQNKPFDAKIPYYLILIPITIILSLVMFIAITIFRIGLFRILEDYFFVIPIVMFSIFCTLSSSCIITNCIIQINISKESEKREKEIQELLESSNNSLRGREVSLTLGSMNVWIQMNLNFVTQQPQIPMGVPLTNNPGMFQVQNQNMMMGNNFQMGQPNQTNYNDNEQNYYPFTNGGDNLDQPLINNLI